jgi:DNA-binding response OmpR family regulator
VRVLVVEDDPVLAKVVARGLREESHAVDVAATYDDAEEAVRLAEYDVVVLDLGLPDGDGLDLCRHIRSRTASRVLIVTARETLSDKVGGLDAGADDYLTKPFAFPELAARVRALLRRPAGNEPTVLTLADIRLDPAAHTVFRGSLLVPLTAREFSLLHYLLTHPGEVVTRSDLLDHVWDANYDGTSNVVDVHVASLRRKLDQPGNPTPIETVRGVGYRVGSYDEVGAAGAVARA